MLSCAEQRCGFVPARVEAQADKPVGYSIYWTGRDGATPDPSCQAVNDPQRCKQGKEAYKKIMVSVYVLRALI